MRSRADQRREGDGYHHKRKAGGRLIERDPGGRAIKPVNVPWIHECTEDEIVKGRHVAQHNRKTTFIGRPLDDYNPWWDDEE